MNLENLLNYQKADLAYKKMRQEISANPDYKNAKSYKAEFDNSKIKMANSEAQADNIIASYNSAMEYIDGHAARIEELCALLANPEIGEEDEAKAVEELTAIQAEVAEWEKKAAQIKANAEKAIADYQAAYKTASQARDKYNDANEKYKKFRESKDGELESLKAEVEKLAPTVEPELMELYKSVAPENHPAFVPAMGDDNALVCGACGMMLAGTASSELKSNGYCRCDTCRRIIYKA